MGVLGAVDGYPVKTTVFPKAWNCSEPEKSLGPARVGVAMNARITAAKPRGLAWLGMATRSGTRPQGAEAGEHLPSLLTAAPHPGPVRDEAPMRLLAVRVVVDDSHILLRESARLKDPARLHQATVAEALLA